MTEPFKIGCHCGFTSDDPQAFLDHCLSTGHVFKGMDLTETGALAELGFVLETIQRAHAAEAAGEPMELPEGAELKALSIEDILTDDTLSEEQKQEILRNLEAIEQLERDRD